VGDAAHELEALLVRPHRQAAHGRFHRRPQPEVCALHREAARLQLREVQHVVDDVEQGIARRPHGLKVVSLLRGQVRAQHELGHADHGIHGGPDLVRHVGQELALGGAGRLGGHGHLLGCAQRFLQSPLRLDALGDVPHDADRAPLAAHPHARDGHLDRDDTSLPHLGLELQ